MTNLGISLKKVTELTGLSKQTVKRALDRSGARRKTVGRSVIYDSDDVAQTLGFSEKTTSSQPDQVEISPRVAEFLDPFIAGD